MAMLDGRRVLISGGTTGLGAAMVRSLSEQGARGVCIDLPGTQATHGWPVLAADVRDEASVGAAVQQALELLGGLDVVLANAGMVPAWSALAEVPFPVWDDVFAVNVRGVFALLRFASPHVAAGGSVVLTGSLNSWRGDPNIAAYVASKHAVLGITRSLAMELGPRDIRVNAVGPGPIATAALRARVAARNPGRDANTVLADMAQDTMLRRLATEEDVANTVVFLCSPMASGITGQIINVDCGVA